MVDIVSPDGRTPEFIAALGRSVDAPTAGINPYSIEEPLVTRSLVNRLKDKALSDGCSSRTAKRRGQELPRLSSPIYELSGHIPVVVVGSGYGGAITASRLARAGQQVWVLERGRELHPGEYPESPHEIVEDMQVHHNSGHIGSRTGLYDVRARGDMNVFVGCGLGGTSLINANVSLRPDPRVFEQQGWPAELRADTKKLEEGYARAQEMLAPQQLPAKYSGLSKLKALQASAQVLPESRFYRPPINVTFKDGPNAAGIQQTACNMCGDCCTGCNVGAKNTVLMNYLPDAVAHGARIFTRVAVHHVSRGGDSWEVHCELLDTGREPFGGPMITITADVVVLAAGTLGSTEILLRSREGLPLSTALGTRFSGNGDVFAFSYNGDKPIDGIGWGNDHHKTLKPVGPCISGIIDLRAGELHDGFVVEEGALAGGLAAYLPAVFDVGAAALGVATHRDLGGKVRAATREVESLIMGEHAGALRNTLLYLVMAHDGSDGYLRLQDNHVAVSWPGVGDKPIFNEISDTLLRATEAQGGTYLKNPLWTKNLGNRLLSVHPLGGCPMGADAASGVVNHKGQVFLGDSGTEVYNSLYVADGSVVPTALGVNPLLTISAIAERTVAQLAEDRGWEIDYDSATPDLPPARPQAVGIEFTERMAGWAATGDDIPDDHGEAARAGQAANTPLSFVFTIVIDDLDAFLDDPDRTAALVGTVNAPAISPDLLQTHGGTFKSAAQDPDSVCMVHMEYQTGLIASDGRRFLLKGRKNLRHDQLLELWPSTTTLFVDVYAGDDEAGPVVARGVLKLTPADFARQLQSMRTTGTNSIAQQLEAKARFGQAFASKLFHIYGGVAATGSQLRDEALPARKKRPLRAPTPTLHPFITDDGVELLLTRYRGGDKGPVMLTHGLGVSSLIFTISTIKTNLVEYLCAHGYDVWLLDYRASIALPASRTQYTADVIAEHDYPAAVEEVRRYTGAPSVQVVAHCFGSTTFMCAMLAGLQGVRSAVCSQIGTDMIVPPLTSMKSGLHVPDVLDRVGLHTLSADAHKAEGWLERAFDRALDFWPTPYEQKCDSAVCHRITFLYAPLYEHDRLNTATHDALGEMFGVAATSAFKHLAMMIRHGAVVGADGSDRYMRHLGRLRMPLTIIHGAKNACFLLESTTKTIARLSEANGPELYTRHVIPQYGHIDCIFGAHASTDVYPKILQGLQPTAQL